MSPICTLYYLLIIPDDFPSCQTELTPIKQSSPLVVEGSAVLSDSEFASTQKHKVLPVLLVEIFEDPNHNLLFQPQSRGFDVHDAFSSNFGHGLELIPTKGQTEEKTDKYVCSHFKNFK